MCIRDRVPLSLIPGNKLSCIKSVESFTQAMGVAFTVLLIWPPTLIFAVKTESQCIFWSNCTFKVVILQLGVMGKLKTGGSGTSIIVSQLRLKPSAATFTSEIKTIVTHPLEPIWGGVFTPEKGPASTGEEILGPSYIKR